MKTKFFEKRQSFWGVTQKNIANFHKKIYSKIGFENLFGRNKIENSTPNVKNFQENDLSYVNIAKLQHSKKLGR